MICRIEAAQKRWGLPTPTFREFNTFVRVGREMELNGELPGRGNSGWFLAWAALLYFTGLRRTDIGAIRWDWIEGDCLRVRRLQGKKSFTIPMHPTLRAVLDEYREWSQTETVVPFDQSTIYRVCRRVSAKAGTPEIRPDSVGRLSLLQWESAYPRAGQFIRSLWMPTWERHAIDRDWVLRSAVAKLAVPPAFVGEGYFEDECNPAQFGFVLTT